LKISLNIVFAITPFFDLFVFQIKLGTVQCPISHEHFKSYLVFEIVNRIVRIFRVEQLCFGYNISIYIQYYNFNCSFQDHWKYRYVPLSPFRNFLSHFYVINDIFEPFTRLHEKKDRRSQPIRLFGVRRYYQIGPTWTYKIGLLDI